MKSRKYLYVIVLMSLLIASQAVPSPAYASGTVRYVKPGGLKSGTCPSWLKACDLQYALKTLAVSGDSLWVKQGTYKPTTSTSRTVSFVLKNGIALYGGFAGSETLRSQRNVKTHVTILSGEIGDPGVVADNSCHVVVGSGTSSSAVLDGFTVTAGSASDSPGICPVHSGGGMYDNSGNPTVANVIFSNNAASYSGGGIQNEVNSSPTLDHITFRINSAPYGGGMYNTGLSKPTLTNVTFDNNISSGSFGGGGMFNDGGSDAILNGVTFTGNSASGQVGGAMVNQDGSSPRVTNVTFSGNTGSNGGAVYNTDGNPSFTNVTFSGNTASGTGGAMYNDTGATVTIRDSIFWGDGSTEVVNNPTGISTINDTILAGVCPTGSTCLNTGNTDPLLGSLANNGGATQTMALGLGSSAIDTGNNSTCATIDQRGISRPQGPVCDAGAFEVTAPTFSSVPASWSFGVIKVGTTSPGKVFTIKNKGAVNLVISTVTLAGVDPGQFHLTSNTCSGATLAPNGTCLIKATFKPTTSGDKFAYINIPDNEAGSPQKILLNSKGGTELAQNGGFNLYPSPGANIPTYWAATYFGSTDGKDTVTKQEGSASVKIANTSMISKTLTQTHGVSGIVGDTYLFSVWGKGQSIPTSAGAVQAQVQLISGDIVVQSKIINFPNGSYGFKQKTVTFTATHPYDSVLIKLVYSKGSGRVWFDGLRLLMSPATIV